MACHTRSNSFPSKSHPVASNFDEHLRKLRSSSSSIFCKLNGLQDLHDCVDKVLRLPLTQQALGQEQQKKCIDELLINGSLRLLDMSSIAKDALLQTKECVQGHLSALRRRRGDEISSEVKKYLTSRKAVKKTIKKALRSLKGCSSPCTNEEQHETIVMLREVEAVTFAVFESLLSLISGPKAQSKLSGWSLVSKLVQPKRVACDDDQEEESDVNDFEKVDVTLSSKFDNNTIHVQNQLKELESSIQDLEQGLECLSRLLIKNRVSLLNIINH